MKPVFHFSYYMTYDFIYKKSFQLSLKLSGFRSSAIITLLSFPSFLFICSYVLPSGSTASQSLWHSPSTYIMLVISCLFILYALVFIPVWIRKSVKKQLLSFPGEMFTGEHLMQIIFNKDCILYIHNGAVKEIPYASIFGFCIIRQTVYLFLREPASEKYAEISSTVFFPVSKKDKSPFSSFLIWNKKIPYLPQREIKYHFKANTNVKHQK